MQFTIGSRILALTFRSSFIFCFLLAAHCNSKDTGDESVYQEDHTKSVSKYGLLKFAQKKVKQGKRVRVAKVANHKQAVVLLHGLNRLSYDFNTMQAILKKKFPGATVVALQDLNKTGRGVLNALCSKTSQLSIKEQAKVAYEEMVKRIGYGSHVVIVGHSQGGLRGFSIICEYWDKLKNENGITIDQLITIATPWKGAPVMRRCEKNAKQVIEKIDKVKYTLNKIDKEYDQNILRYFFKIGFLIAKPFPRCFEQASFLLEKCDILPGVMDLKPDSPFICDYVTSGLKRVDLPIKAIAGILGDFSQLFDPFPSDIHLKDLQELNHTYAKVIGGDAHCEHDMLLPVSTQHAALLEKKDFECIKVYGTCHGNKVGISVKKGLSELNNNQVIEKVVVCVAKAFYEEK